MFFTLQIYVGVVFYNIRIIPNNVIIVSNQQLLWLYICLAHVSMNKICFNIAYDY